MKKTVLCLFLIAAMLMSVLISCGSSEENNGKTTEAPANTESKTEDKPKDKFEGEFKEATVEQKTTALKKLEKLSAIEKAAKNNEQIDGKDVTKSNMIMNASVLLSEEITQDGILMEATGGTKTVEKYDFSTPGSYKLFARYEKTALSIIKSIPQEMIDQMPEGITADSLIGKETGTTSILELYVDTASGILYVYDYEKSVTNPLAGPTEKTTKGYLENLPMEQFEALFSQGGQTLSVEEILKSINENAGLVSVDSNGNIRVTKISNDTVEDLEYTLIFENDNDYSAKKTFKLSEEGHPLNGEVTIRPTNEAVTEPADKDAYVAMSASEVYSLLTNYMSSL